MKGMINEPTILRARFSDRGVGHCPTPIFCVNNNDDDEVRRMMGALWQSKVGGKGQANVENTWNQM
jgi:hypothetical protein